MLLHADMQIQLFWCFDIWSTPTAIPSGNAEAKIRPNLQPSEAPFVLQPLIPLMLQTSRPPTLWTPSLISNLSFACYFIYTHLNHSFWLPTVYFFPLSGQKEMLADV